MNNKLVSLVFASLVAAGAARAQPAVNAAASGDAQHGQALFKSDGCWECHGTIGQGGGAAGPRITPMALPYEAFIQQLRTPRGQMPPFEAQVVSNEDAVNIYAYLKSIPPARAAKDIPLLNE